MKSSNDISAMSFISGIAIMILCFLTGTMFGRVIGQKANVEQAAEVYDDKYKEELDAIYELLSAQAFSIRTNMNLSLKTNHYLTHEFSEQLCPDCLVHYEYLVENMPEMPERDQVWFDFFNKDLVEEAKRQQGVGQ
jgi:enamine deaminase RidA (YjgF/YER057c/UK114 family)